MGWCAGRLCSVIFEIRHDSAGVLPSVEGNQRTRAVLCRKRLKEAPQPMKWDLTRGCCANWMNEQPVSTFRRQAVIKTLLERPLDGERAAKSRQKRKAGRPLSHRRRSRRPVRTRGRQAFWYHRQRANPNSGRVENRVADCRRNAHDWRLARAGAGQVFAVQ
jgi:hypothetical protein